jgi:dipeptidyl aminopeptidase/acylaminoacyl peptidase
MEWLSLSREGHGVFDEQTRKEVYEQILDFLDRHLPVGGEGKAIASAD